MRSIDAARIFLGGHSYGGRQASILAAEGGPAVVNALLLLSYPLHPPKKPEDVRTQHFPDLRTPCLFVHGTHDAFGTTEELEEAMQLIPAATDLVTIPGVGHELARGRFDWRDIVQRLRSLT
ncbi:MAG: dienelactone hydrolase family protein [Acidobacteriaceae bacterium]|nr:dienelactone hydrolase family protein [Acidobacteriaceae bacterium]